MKINIKLLTISIRSCAYVNKVLFCPKLRLSVYVKGVNRNSPAYYVLQLSFWRVKWNVVRAPVVLSFWSSFFISMHIVVWRSISDDYYLIHIICCIDVVICHLYLLVQETVPPAALYTLPYPTVYPTVRYRIPYRMVPYTLLYPTVYPSVYPTVYPTVNYHVFF